MTCNHQNTVPIKIEKVPILSYCKDCGRIIATETIRKPILQIAVEEQK